MMRVKILPQHLNAIVNSVYNYNGIIAVDMNGVITIFNPTAEKILGIPQDQAVGKPIDDIVPGSGLDKVIITVSVKYFTHFNEAINVRK